MKHYIYLILSLFILPLSAKIEVLDRVAIIVGEGVVLESQIDNMMETIKDRYKDQGALTPPEEVMIEQVKERLIIEELQLQMAQRAGIRIGDGELNQAFIEIAESNGLTLEEFIESLESQGAPYEELRKQVRKEMIIQRVQRGNVGGSVNITEQELDGFLATEGAVKELSPELFIRQILVSDQIQANQLITKIKAGESFSSLAKTYSNSSNASSGGEMCWRNLIDLRTLFSNALKGKK